MPVRRPPCIACRELPAGWVCDACGKKKRGRVGSTGTGISRRLFIGMEPEDAQHSAQEDVDAADGICGARCLVGTLREFTCNREQDHPGECCRVLVTRATIQPPRSGCMAERDGHRCIWSAGHDGAHRQGGFTWQDDPNPFRAHGDELQCFAVHDSGELCILVRGHPLRHQGQTGRRWLCVDEEPRPSFMTSSAICSEHGCTLTAGHIGFHICPSPEICGAQYENHNYLFTCDRERGHNGPHTRNGVR